MLAGWFHKSSSLTLEESPGLENPAVLFIKLVLSIPHAPDAQVTDGEVYDPAQSLIKGVPSCCRGDQELTALKGLPHLGIHFNGQIDNKEGKTAQEIKDQVKTQRMQWSGGIEGGRGVQIPPYFVCGEQSNNPNQPHNINPVCVGHYCHCPPLVPIDPVEKHQVITLMFPTCVQLPILPWCSSYLVWQ